MTSERLSPHILLFYTLDTLFLNNFIIQDHSSQAKRWVPEGVVQPYS